MLVNRLSRREWEALGALMLPRDLGGKSTLGQKTAAKLEALGYVERYEKRIGGKGNSVIDRIPVVIRGWQMTISGNLAYCTWAAAHCEGEPDAG
jgi:hypothetical protein